MQEQPFQVLALLLENPGAVVTREELRLKLWPADTFVDFDNALNRAINKIREALCDSAEEPQFIETLARRGYRLIRKTECEMPQVRSLAVLPLENLSRDPGTRVFRRGLNRSLDHHAGQNRRAARGLAHYGDAYREYTSPCPKSRGN